MGDELKLNWWELEREETNQVKAYLYRDVRDDNGVRMKGAQVTAFPSGQGGRMPCSELPDPHEIGTMFGSGEYRLMIREWIDGKIQPVKTELFELGETYDKYKEVPEQKKEEVVSQIVEPISSVLSGEDIAKAVAQGIAGSFQGIIGSVAPFVPSIIELLKPKESSFGKQLEENYSSMNRVLEDNMKSQQKNMNEFMRDFMKSVSESVQGISFAANNEEYEEEEDSPMSAIFSMVKPIIAMQLPAILGGKGKEVIDGVKNHPLFIQVMSNPAVMKELQSWIMEEHGLEAVNTVMELLNS